MKTVLFFPNPLRAEALQLTETMIRGLSDCAFLLPDDCPLSAPARKLPLEQAVREADLIVSLGGDGTILRLAPAAVRAHVPVLGINLGKMGFMAELEPEEWPLAQRVLRGEYRTECRMLLDVTVFREGVPVVRELALNDAVVSGGAAGRSIALAAEADGKRFLAFAGDGLILATPTGSTAYSLSAGGPVLEPTARNILATPICPHAPMARCFVFSPECRVSVETTERRAAYLVVDGARETRLKNGDRLEVSRAEECLELVRISEKTFYETLWGKMADKHGGQSV